MPTFGELLRSFRLRVGSTQEELGKHLGLSRNTIRAWEGDRIPRESAYWRSIFIDALHGIKRQLELSETEIEQLRQAADLLFTRSSPSKDTPTSRPCVLLISAPTDKAMASRLRSDLQRQGITLWRGEDKAVDPPERKECLQQAFHEVQAALLVASPSSCSARSVRDDLEIAEMYNCPVYIFWTAGEGRRQILSPHQTAVHFLDVFDARGARYEKAVEELTVVLRALPSTLSQNILETDSIQKPFFASRNPYKGLRAFRCEDAHDFFGRDRLIDDLVGEMEKILAQREESARLLGVIGPSGSGKSSVVQAGLLPRLQKDEVQGSSRWVYLQPLVPEKHPLEALTVTLGNHFPEKSLTTIRQDLCHQDTRGLHVLARQLIEQQSGLTVLLVVDQFEELFTQTTDEQERKQFIDLLTTACREPGGPLFVILTLRADFYDRPMHYSELARILEKQQKSVLPMSVRELQAAIEKPAALPDVHLSFDEKLVGELLLEMQGQIGALPLLQFTLDQLVEQRQGNQLTVQVYREMGGIKGALSRHAESTYAHLPSEEHRRLARTLFLRLVDPGVTEQEGTRRRASLAEFTLDDPSKDRLLRETLEAFIDARLLTTNTQIGVPTVEVSHEALIREWGRLADWLHEAQADIRLQQAISKDAASWEHSQKRRDRLYRGSQLREAQAWARRNLPSGKETAFLRVGARHALWLLVRMVLIGVLLVSTSGVALWSILLLLSTSTTVTTLNDSGSGSLRQVLTTAKAESTITFDPALVGATIRLTSDLNITQSVSIRGPGAGKLFISSANDNDVIRVLRGVTVTISGLTFANSSLGGLFSFLNNEGTLTISQSSVSGNSSNGSGGAISNQGDLTISDSTVSDNSSWNTVGSGGGAIFNQGLLTITKSRISNNRADASGGGIENLGTLIIEGSTIAENASLASGGGIRNLGTLTLLNSTITGNSSLDAGGGIDNQDLLTVTRSTIAENTTSSLGGGMNNDEVLQITNSLILDNRASGAGGGLANKGKLTLSHCQIAHNTANGNGGGIYYQENVLDQKSPSTITDCTIVDNTAHSGGGLFEQGPSVSQYLKLDHSEIADNRALLGPEVGEG